MCAHGSALICRFAAFLLASLACVVAHASDPRENQVLVVDIPRAELSRAAQALTRLVGADSVGVDTHVGIEQDAMAGPLRGTYTFSAAMHELLDPLGLTYRWLTPRAIFITRVPEPQTTSHKEQKLPPPPPPANAHEAMESIIVIGSYASNWDSPANEKQVLDQRAIASYGASTLPDILRYLPQVPFSSSSISSQWGDQYANLRGLGAASTLLLINGRRLSPSAAAYGNGAFDLNAIPLTAIRRIEVLPNSPSTVIGSDAAGGIINIVLQEEIADPRISVSYGASEGGAAERRASLGLGTSAERYHGAVTLDVFDRQSLLGDTRDFSRNQDYRRFGGADYRVPFSSPGNIFSATGQNLPGLNAPFAAIPTVNGTTPLTPGDFASTAGTMRLESLGSYSSLISGASRIGLIGQGDFLLTSDATLFAETQLVRRKNQYLMGPPILANALVSASNPYNPFRALGTPIFVNVLLTGMAPRTIIANAELHRGVAGIRWSGANWHGELAVTATKDVMRVSDENELDPLSVARALSETDPAFALNPFGNGPLGSVAVMQSLAAPAAQQSFTSRGNQVYLRVDGTLLPLPAGALRLRAGSEWREESAENQYFSVDPRRSTSAVFAELSIPLLGGEWLTSWAQKMSATVGIRDDRYSSLSSELTPQYSLTWLVTSAVKLRAIYSDTSRPPSLFDLYPPPRAVGSFTAIDPLRHNTLGSFNVVAGGNPDLVPTSGHTWSAGLDWAPRDADGLYVGLTYWQIAIVQDIFPTSILAVVGQEDLFPGRVVRAAPTASDLAAGLPGVIQSVDVRPGNFGYVDAGGVDLNVSANFDMRAGQLTPQLSVTWNSRFRRELVRGEFAQQQVGVASELGTIPRWRAAANLQWKRGPLALFTAMRFSSGYDDASNGLRTGDRIPALTTFDTQISFSSPAFLRSSVWDDMAVTAGAQNLFNTQPHFAQVGHTYGYDVTQTDLRGRFWYVRLLKNF